MNIVFSIIALIGVLYFLVKKRQFDFFSLAFFSSLVYFLPGFFGIVQHQAGSGKYPVEIITETYLVMILVMSSIVVALSN